MKKSRKKLLAKFELAHAQNELPPAFEPFEFSTPKQFLARSTFKPTPFDKLDPLDAIFDLDRPGRNAALAWLNDRDYATRYFTSATQLAKLGVLPPPVTFPNSNRVRWGAFYDSYEIDRFAPTAVPGLPFVLAGVPAKSLLGDRRKIKVVKSLPWVPLDVQTAGIRCGHVKLIGLVLPLSLQGLGVAAILASLPSYQNGHTCVDNLTPDDVVAYANLARTAGVSIKTSLPYLQESISPIDFTLENLNTLAEPNTEIFATLKEALSDREALFVEPKKTKDIFTSLGLFHLMQNMRLFVIYPNCD